MKHLVKLIALGLFALFLLPGIALGTTVLPGFDLLVHQDPSGWDFGPVPIPADFFGPGSDPFDGGVPAKGKPLGSSPLCPGDLGLADMLIMRSEPAVLPGIPSDDIIAIEIVELSLVSVAPITVSYNGGASTELWDVEITLSSIAPSEGSMLITQYHPNGGAFDVSVILRPYFTFTRVSDSYTLTLDGAGTYDDIIECAGVPWVYGAPPLQCPPCAGNFIPGHDDTQKVPYVMADVLSSHTVMSACTINTPTLSQWGMIATIGLILTAGVLWISRRRRAAAAPVA